MKMGIFDKWRRKKHRAEMSGTKVPAPRPISAREMSSEVQAEIVSLVAEYEQLYKRRSELQAERSELTERLDRGELTAIEFRKLLMEKIQEAAQVAESLKATAARLTELGYRGVLR